MFEKLAPRRIWCLLAAIGTALALTGCASGSADDTPPTRVVKDAVGRQTIPVNPKRVLALDEYGAVTMLMVGARPSRVFATASSPTSQTVLKTEGVPVDVKDGFLSKPDFESVAAVKPDLIVASNAGPLPQAIDRLRKIAPTVLLTYGGSWRDTLDEAGRIFDRDHAARAAERVLAHRLDDVAGRLPDRASISVVFSYQGQPHFPALTAPMSGLLKQLGLTRPAAERSSKGEKAGELIVPFSPENLTDHDADRVAILSGTNYDSRALRAVPIFKQLPASRAGHTHDVDGEAWFGNSAFTTWWILDDLLAMYDDDGAVGRRADTVERWKDLQNALEDAA